MKLFKSRAKVLGFDDREVLLKGVPFIGVLASLLLFGDLISQKKYILFFFSFFVTISYVSIYYLTLREVHYYFIKKYPSFVDRKKRIWTSLGVMSIVFVSVFHLGHLVITGIVRRIIPDYIPPVTIIEIMVSALFTLLTYILYESIYSRHKLRIALMEKETLEKSNILSQLMGLRSQINPHFLFNSLNTVIALISKDTVRAENFVDKLSKVYSYMLERKDDKLTTLDQELKWLNAYIHLLKERFGDNLIVFIDVDPEYEKYFVLPLCLQITFENAIKHNIITTDQPLSVQVFSDGNSLCISNNLQKKKNVFNSTNFGLDNLHKRFLFFTDKKIEIEETETTFKVCLPLLKSLKLKNEQT